MTNSGNPQGGSSLPLFPDQIWNLDMLVFVEVVKPENPVKNSRTKDENRQPTRYPRPFQIVLQYLPPLSTAVKRRINNKQK